MFLISEYGASRNNKDFLGHREERYLLTAQRFIYGNLVSLPFENLLWFELINFLVIDG